MSPMQRRYFWDFFGPQAARTAEHFRRHLDEFLQKNACPGETSLESKGEAHSAVGCRVESAWFERIERTLRPKRHEEG
jgi:hypothetical protein